MLFPTVCLQVGCQNLFLTAADQIYMRAAALTSTSVHLPASFKHCGASLKLSSCPQSASTDFKCCPAARPHLRQLLSNAVSAWQMQATSAPLYENTFGEVFNSKFFSAKFMQQKWNGRKVFFWSQESEHFSLGRYFQIF